MRKQMRAATAAMGASLALSLSGCGYNTFQTTDEQVKATVEFMVGKVQ